MDDYLRTPNPAKVDGLTEGHPEGIRSRVTTIHVYKALLQAPTPPGSNNWFRYLALR
jgi:hypothetical protein